MDQFLFESETLFTFSSNFYYKLCIFYLGSTSDWSLVESVNDVEYAFLLKANVHFVYAGFFMLQWACAVYGFPFFSFILIVLIETGAGWFTVLKFFSDSFGFVGCYASY